MEARLETVSGSMMEARLATVSGSTMEARLEKAMEEQLGKASKAMERRRQEDGLEDRAK